jgi:hypothetical protein
MSLSALELETYSFIDATTPVPMQELTSGMSALGSWCRRVWTVSG